jgi:hypothetical protein
MRVEAWAGELYWRLFEHQQNRWESTETSVGARARR